MAIEVDLYACLWRPEENGIKVSSEMINFLEIGIEKLKSNPDKYKEFNPPNGWGNYEDLVSFAEKVLEACNQNLDAHITTWR